VRISAKSDYALRALIELANMPDGASSEHLASVQDIPHKYLEGILVHLRKTGFLVSSRGSDGGYRLARDPSTVSVADILRAIDGPITTVRGECPQDLEYQGSAKHLQAMWIATRASIRQVLEKVSIADLARGSLPSEVSVLSGDPDAWTDHWYR
jgi:Rrf2 family protein